MIVLLPHQMHAFGGVALRTALDRLCLALVDMRPELSGQPLDALRAKVEQCVNEAFAIGLTSKADIHTFVEFALFDYPGFYKSREFQDFIHRSAKGDDQKMLGFIGDVHPLYWRRYARKAQISDGATS
jgi:hypothetical protein